jgi:DNA ligase 1
MHFALLSSGLVCGFLVWTQNGNSSAMAPPVAPSAKKTQQSTLNAFFGGGAAPKTAAKGATQTSLDAFLGTSGKGKPTKRKSPSSVAASPAASPAAVQTKKKKKRLVIEDSSDEEEHQLQDEDEAVTKHAGTATTANETPAGLDPSTPSPSKGENDEQHGEVDKEEGPPSESGLATKLDSKSDANKTKNGKKPKDESSPKKKSASSPAKWAKQSGDKHKPSALLESAPKGQFKSDKELLKEATWEDVLPFEVLCQAFADIEAITSRLAIQEILTTLFRKIFLKTPNSMTDVLYLASNSVAAAYECVELGIGDAILLKAVAAATGTAVPMIKQKYETAGDLGSVAAACKGKQKTLGGFFGATAKVPLTVKEVLKVFREIAETKGNQAQKGKIEKIQKLVVRATTVETKYIIRGLQGKLRIGLAQSTVLISLAHALALTTPPTVDMDDIPASEGNMT